MKILFGIGGAIVGAAFGVIATKALVELLGGGNTLAEGFLLFIAAPVAALIGIVVGALCAVRIVRRLREKPSSATSLRKRRRVLLGLVVGIPMAFAAVILIDNEAVKPPSDSVMLRHFEGQQTILEKLVQMAISDPELVRVDENWTMPADTQSIGVSHERLAEYRELLRRAGTPRGFKALPDGAGYDFYFWLRGSTISADEQKGFAYRTSSPEGVAQSLDGIRTDPGKDLVVYRHIRGSWYLIYEYVPD